MVLNAGDAAKQMSPLIQALVLFGFFAILIGAAMMMLASEGFLGNRK